MFKCVRIIVRGFVLQRFRPAPGNGLPYYPTSRESGIGVEAGYGIRVVAHILVHPYDSSSDIRIKERRK